MRLPYVPDPPAPGTPTDPEEQATRDRIAARRAPRPLTPLDLALLHSPPVADGWNSFLGAVRTRTSAGVSADLRELAICRVAAVNRAWYEWAHHAPLAGAAGVPAGALGFVAASGAVGLDVHEGEGEVEVEGEGEGEGRRQGRAGLSGRQWAVLCLADEMTRNVEVRDETFAVVRGLFDEREVVELVAIVACYNCVSRFLVALDVGEKNGSGPDAGH